MLITCPSCRTCGPSDDRDIFDSTRPDEGGSVVAVCLGCGTTLTVSPGRWRSQTVVAKPAPAGWDIERRQSERIDPSSVAAAAEDDHLFSWLGKQETPSEDERQLLNSWMWRRAIPVFVIAFALILFPIILYGGSEVFKLAVYAMMGGAIAAARQWKLWQLRNDP